jgi:hypothetical protein
MQPTVEKTIQVNVKRRVVVMQVILPLFISFIVFTNMLGNPRFQDIRTIDVVRLITIGGCWGVAFAGLAMLIRSKFRKN